MVGICFLDFPPCQVTAGELVLISYSPAFLYKLRAEAGNTHSGVSWDGKPDIIPRVWGCSRHLGVCVAVGFGGRVGGSGMVRTCLGKGGQVRGEVGAQRGDYTTLHLQEFHF